MLARAQPAACRLPPRCPRRATQPNPQNQARALALSTQSSPTPSRSLSVRRLARPPASPGHMASLSACPAGLCAPQQRAAPRGSACRLAIQPQRTWQQQRGAQAAAAARPPAAAGATSLQLLLRLLARMQPCPSACTAHGLLLLRPAGFAATDSRRSPAARGAVPAAAAAAVVCVAAAAPVATAQVVLTREQGKNGALRKVRCVCV